MSVAKRAYELGCTCPIRPCPIHDKENEKFLRFEFPDLALHFLEGMDDAITGVSGYTREVPKVCYDQQKVYEFLRSLRELTHDEAVDWMFQHQQKVSFIVMLY